MAPSARCTTEATRICGRAAAGWAVFLADEAMLWAAILAEAFEHDAAAAGAPGNVSLPAEPGSGSDAQVARGA